MAVLTIRRLDDDVKEALRVRAARAGRSMEEEARSILTQAVRGMTGPALLARATALFGEDHGLRPEEELAAGPRERGRADVDFEAS